ncbi:hypothetical protein TeGR_g3441, partial [Tetraparma gracilis]
MRFLSLSALLLAPAAFCSDSTPTQIHLALAGDDGSGNSNAMTVSYQTEVDCPASVIFGTTPDNLDRTATGSSSSYYATYDHHVILSDLDADTTHYYQILPDGPVNSFTTPPKSSSDAGSSVSFAFFGDLGLVNGDSARAYMTTLASATPPAIDLVLHAGDVGYADDSFLHFGCYLRFCYEEKWNEFMDSMEPIVSKLPWMTAPGNHEADCHDPACMLSRTRRDKLSNFTAYNSRFRMPSEESGGVMNMWHSFNHGPVHFVSLDLETGFPGAAEETRYVLKCGGFGDQLTWLEEDLRLASQNEDTPWIVLSGHHPMYNGGSVDRKMQAAIEPLLLKYGVDVFFTGHVHS